MKQGNGLSLVLKGIALLIVDIVSMLFVFSIWTLINLPLFPWSIAAVVTALALLNAVILLSSFIQKEFGVAVASAFIVLTTLYYLFVMIYTGIVYPFVSVRWYLIVTLLALGVFVIAATALLLLGRQKKEDDTNQNAEKSNTLNVTVLLLNIGGGIEGCRNILSNEDFLLLMTSYNTLKERLDASTPFGRVNRPVVTTIENQIISKLSEISRALTELRYQTEKQHISVTSIITSFEIVKGFVQNKEKLIVQ